jgi:hypothetical protein
MSKALCWMAMRSRRRACLLKRSLLKRREGEGGERSARLRKGVRSKRRVFSKQCRCLDIEFLAWYLPNPSLPQGIWSRAPFASEKEQYSSSSSLVAAPRVGFQYPFPLAPPFPPRPLPSCLTFPLPVSLSLGCPRRSRVVCGGTVKPVRLSSLEVLQTWGARGEASVSASACHRARPRT